MSNSQMGSLAIGILLVIFTYLGFAASQNSGSVPFAPAHATDYGYGGQAGPLTYNGHLVPETVSDAAASDTSGASQVQANPGQHDTSLRIPCSKPTGAAKPCSNSKKRCWLVGTGKGSVQPGPTGHLGQTTSGQAVGHGPGVVQGGGQAGSYGAQGSGIYGYQGQLGGHGQLGHTQFPTTSGTGTHAFGSGVPVSQQHFPSVNGHVVQPPQGYKIKQSGFGQAGEGLQHGGSPVGNGQGHFGGTGTPHSLGQATKFGTGSGPYGQTQPGGLGQVGGGQPLGGSLGQGVGQPQIGGLGYPSGTGQHVGIGSGLSTKLKPWSTGQYTPPAPHQGPQIVQTAGGVGLGGIAGYKIKQYVGAGIEQQQPVFQQPVFSGHLPTQSGQSGQTGSQYRPLSQPQASTKFGVGQTGQLGGQVGGHQPWSPPQHGAQYPVGTHGAPQIHQGYPTGQKVKYPDGSQPTGLGYPSQHGLTHPGSLAQPPQGIGYPTGSKITAQQIGQQGLSHPGGIGQPSQGGSYPAGSKITTQQSGYPTIKQVASQQQAGFSSGSQVIAQQAAAYPGSQGYHSVQIASQQKLGYPSGSHLGSGYPSGPQSGSGYPSGSQLGSGYPSGSQLGSGYPSGPQSGSGYPSGSKFGSGYPSGSQLGSGYPSGPQSGSGYPSGSKFGSGYPSGSQLGSGYPSGSQLGSGYPSGSQFGSGYPSGSQTAPHSGSYHGVQQPIGSQIPISQGIRYPTGTKFVATQGISQQTAQGAASQLPFHQSAGYPTPPQKVASQPSIQYPTGPHSSYTKSTGTQHIPVGHASSSGGQHNYPHFGKGPQGLQHPQYPAAFPGHGHQSGAPLNLQPAPPGFRYSLKPK